MPNLPYQGDKFSDDGNGRVTLAVLSTKLDHIIKRLDDFDDGAEGREIRIRTLEQKMIHIEERTGIAAALQAAFTAVAATLAGWIGTR